ncbi:MAG TPA: DUF1722 domain-containing protein [Deltaproteobacteria bacterium]|jgi:uncharacterized protein YbgA (DUF1722 family)/uncharacterized protein YbbK (DUF523 family)|nr:DUF1722 domain-containing protein [Deltaproteobacteria bacterium]
MSPKVPQAVGQGPIRIGISACLLGHEVRFDGGHKRDRFLADTFGRFVEWVPVCPEVELGMGTPREPVRLEQDAAGLHLVAPKSGRDWTRPMRRFAARRVRTLAALDLSGYVLKKDSPSCGMERVRVYGQERTGPPRREGRGLFASALIAANPLLPVEEEGRLWNPRLRENFVVRVFAYHRLRAFFGGRWTFAGVVAFHASYRFTLLAHSPEAYRRLGRLIAKAKEIPRPELQARYEGEFMGALSKLATKRSHTNVLEHLAGYFKTRLDAASRAELAALIGEYRRGLVPLTVPITLIRHHARHHGVSSLEDQVYLEPHPKERMLRNHI